MEEVPKLWKRYLDDTYSEFYGCEVEGQQLMDMINQLHESIKFPETQMGDSIVFLDFNISINTDSRALEFELYVKPTNVGIFLHYESAHPKSILLSVAENELRRALKRSNTDSGAERSLNKIKKLLFENGYPANIVEKCCAKVQGSSCLQVTIKNKNNESDYIGSKNILKVHYIDEQHKRKLLKELNASDLIKEHTRVIFIPGPKLNDLLVRSKLNHVKCTARAGFCYVCNSQENATQCMVKNFVYSLKCGLCEAEYIGESGRHFRVRMREHFLSVVNCSSDHAMGAHYVKCHVNEEIPDLPFQCNLIRKCKDFVDRQLWQSIEIKYRQPRINIQLMGTSEHNLDWGIIS